MRCYTLPSRALVLVWAVVWPNGITTNQSEVSLVSFTDPPAHCILMIVREVCHFVKDVVISMCGVVRGGAMGASGWCFGVRPF